MQAPVKATITATILTVNWNCRNLEMLSYTLRPHITALTMLVKLSSVRMMSEASLATSVPAMPWEKEGSKVVSNCSDIKLSFPLFCCFNWFSTELGQQPISNVGHTIEIQQIWIIISLYPAESGSASYFAWYKHSDHLRSESPSLCKWFQYFKYASPCKPQTMMKVICSDSSSVKNHGNRPRSKRGN